MKTENICSILPKKIRELDHLVNKALTLEPENPVFKLIHEDFKQRLSFLKNLLSAEIKSSHPAKQHHLKHMSERVDDLEAAFSHRRTGSVTTTTTASTLDHVNNVDDDNVDDDDGDGHASKCSCTESCLQDDEDVDYCVLEDLQSTLGQEKEGFCDQDLDEEKKAAPWKVYNNPLFGEKVDDAEKFEKVFLGMSQHNGVVENEKEDVKADVDLMKCEKRLKGLGLGKFCRAVSFVIGMLAMGLVMMDTSVEYDVYKGHGNFLTPT